VSADDSTPKGSAADRQELLRRILEARKTKADRLEGEGTIFRAAGREEIPESFYRIEKFPQYYQMHLHRSLADRAGLRSPYFLIHEGIAHDTTIIGNREYINFGTYDYLGINGDDRLTAAAFESSKRFGTSASASRLVSGERPPHRALEQTLASLHGTEDAAAFVSGYSTNVTVIATIVGPKDLILLDRLAHNSVIQGAKLSGAMVQTFPHDDWQALDETLKALRHRYERVLVVVEGIYSMDGDICSLDRFVEVKNRHKALLMVDEAHSMGALGKTGRGIGEHFGLPAAAVEIWMGTLSKTFAGCGGYVAGSVALVELLKFSAPGFIFSVGMPPPIASAVRTAVEIMLAEPSRVDRLRENGSYFLQLAREHGLNVGLTAGLNIIPVVIGRSVLAARLSNALFDRGINVQPMIFPAVEEKSARLRFFVSASHSQTQIRKTVEATAEELARLSTIS
jgi:8-amino-7-oxononanoate synthase